MAISVFGLGYVGAIASTCLANDGFFQGITAGN
jgi:UDP-glucose 6-dehydrogenase